MVLTITLLIYSPALFYHFVGDDYGGLLKLMADTNSQKALEYRWPGEQGCYLRPLNWLPFLLGYSISGMPLPLEPRWQDNSFLIPYHILHLLFHLMNVFLVYLIARFIFKSTGYAAFSALIFSVHPVNSEVICWVSAFADIALVFFSLLSIILFSGFFLCKKRITAILFYSGSLSSFILALFTKETALCLPFLIILASYFLQKKEDFSAAGKKRPGFWTGYFLIAAFYLILRKSFLPIEGLYWREFFIKILERRVFKLAYYLRDLIFPFDLAVIKQIAYQYSLRPVFIITGFLPIGLFLFILIFRLRKNPLFILCLGFIAVTLFLPTIGLFAAGRRHVYFPVVAYSILLVSFLSHLKKKYIMVFLLLLFIGLEILTSLKRNDLFRFNGSLVQKGLFELKKALPGVEPDSIIYLVGIPGVSRNTPAFYAMPEDKIKFIYRDKNLNVNCLSIIHFAPHQFGAGFKQGRIRESSINFLDNFTLLESMQTTLEDFIRVQGQESVKFDQQWTPYVLGGTQFKILERDEFGNAAKVMYRLDPEIVRGRKVYFVGFKEGRMRVLK